MAPEAPLWMLVVQFGDSYATEALWSCWTYQTHLEMTGVPLLEGRFGEDRVFKADELLTKCGSRYEASPEELRAGDTTGLLVRCGRR